MSRPFITTLVDTYNHESFIEEAIDSVLEQDIPVSEMQILVVDDGSTDKTPELVRKFGPRVRLLRKINGGQASAFNAGVPEAQGEIVAFLDGDDWWAPDKLTAVAEAFAADGAIGLVGHGITQVDREGRQRVEKPRDISRFRIASVEEAKMFRMRRGFLGTSRMAYRREVLGQIGTIPEVLKFEADEYLFTLAGLFADVLILPQALTFYRLHDKNLFQLGDGDAESIRRKQRVLAALATALQEKFEEHGLPTEIANIIVECVQVEAEILRLVLESGYPWETVSTELKILRVFHSDASMWQHLFSLARLVPALVMPAGAYYRWRHRLSRLELYNNLRRKFLPFPVPNHVERQEKRAP
jgi:glycosyltransferase involved in cell wall biosynthesis